MADQETDDPEDLKQTHLRIHSNLNPHPEKVAAPLFLNDDFFDSRDLVQVKYEMLRKVQTENQPIGQTAAEFGFTRPTFYETQKIFESQGLIGLIAKKRGPQSRHKLNPEIIDYLFNILDQEGPTSSASLVERVSQHFGIKVHQRTIERALKATERKKKRKTMRKKH